MTIRIQAVLLALITANLAYSAPFLPELEPQAQYQFRYALASNDPEQVEPDTPIDFQTMVRPILEKNCVACHACTDAPCQLKMESPMGLLRGASPVPVYDGTRLEAVEPTRLHIDAHVPAQWRLKGFHPVLSYRDGENLMQQFLQLGAQQPFPHNMPVPDELDVGSDQHQCVKENAFADFAEEYPLHGMPFGMTRLQPKELAVLQRWFQEGSPVSAPPVRLSEKERNAIDRWETLLNNPKPKYRLLARYLYEHWFLANLYIDASTGHFFKMVRSSTPPGRTPRVINTTRPNDDPGDTFYYRLRLNTDTRVHKAHIPYAINQARYQQIMRLFVHPPWQVEQLPGYSAEEAANPFQTFAAIPARSRYQFLLNDAEYFVRTFIRGPVCHGPVATNVIRDRFWVMFQHPETDLFVQQSEFAEQAQPLLQLPGQQGALAELGSAWLDHQGKRNDYFELRHQWLQRTAARGPSGADIWLGDGHNPSAFLTVMRHHDNASVVSGWRGTLPTTLWWMDYPLFERSYYQLVVNFNVFGSVAHQTQTRLYYDLIRNEAELNLLRLLPASSRAQLYDQWYAGIAQIKQGIAYPDVDTRLPSALDLRPTQPLADLVSFVRGAANHTILPPPATTFADHKRRTAQQLRPLTEHRAEQLPLVKFLPDASLLHIVGEGQAPDARNTTLFTLLRDRAHRNVAFMLGESLRYEDDKDRLTLLPGIAASYPNFIFSVKQTDVGAFVSAALAVDDEADMEAFIKRWGVRRTHRDFWRIFTDINATFAAREPLTFGILDLNRYSNM